MTINEAYDEWENLGGSRKFEILTNLCRYICFEGDPESDTVYDFLYHFCDLEAEDYFGTEGLKV